MASWFEDGFDLLLTPTCAEPPPALGHFQWTDEDPNAGFARAVPYTVFTSPFNMTGQPGISLPLHWSEDGLPIGAQLVAPCGREDVLLRVAAQLEAIQPFNDRIPPLHASR
jgi:amidase